MGVVGTVKGRLLEKGGSAGRAERGLSCPTLDLVLPHLPGQRIAVHPQRTGGLREAARALSEDARDEALFELVNGIVELDAFVDHFLDEPFEAFADHCRSCPVRRRNASTYFSRVFSTTSSG